jgi:hypothetical protein
MIAAKAKVLPEQLSPARLFFKLAQVASEDRALQWSAIETRALNPGTKIPNFHRYSTMYTWPRIYNIFIVLDAIFKKPIHYVTFLL